MERHNGTDRNRNAQEGAEDVLLLEGLVAVGRVTFFADLQLQLLLASKSTRTRIW